MTDTEKRALLMQAEKARSASHCPYSGISVGAALLTEAGKLYTGANIENAAFSPSVCAERVALFKAFSEGERKFRAIAVCGGPAGKRGRPEFSPCGVCRQVMAELCHGDLEILLESEDGKPLSYRLEALLPHGFDKNLL